MKRYMIMLTWGGVSKKLICFALKAGYVKYFKIIFYTFHIFVYVTNFRPLTIQKMCKIMGYIMPGGKKSDHYLHKFRHRSPSIYYIII